MMTREQQLALAVALEIIDWFQYFEALRGVPPSQMIAHKPSAK